MKSKTNDEKNEIRCMVRFTPTLWDRLVERAKEEHQDDNMAAFIRKICRVYLNDRNEKSDESEAVRELLQERDEIIKKQSEIMSNAQDVFKKAAEQKKPINYEITRKKVMNFLISHRGRLVEISEKTGIAQNDLTTILGQLIMDGEIKMDKNWRYYKD